MSKTYVRCGKCGSEFRSLEWKEGLKCPGCRSDELIPIEYENEDGEGELDSSPSYVPEEEQECPDDENKTAWEKSPVVGAIAVVLILFGVIRLGFWSKGPVIITYTEAYQCAKCGKTAEYPLNHPEEPPLACWCGERTLYKQYRCGVCGHLFAWEAPPDPGELDEESLSGTEEERNRIINAHNEKLDAVGSFSMPCPQCQSEKVFEEWTKSHKAIMRKYKKHLSEWDKKDMNEKYGIEF